MIARNRKTLLVTTFLLIALAAGAGGASSRGPPPCPDFREHPVTGPACVRENGLLEVYDGHGRSLGFTHGPDRAPESASGELGTTAAVPVHCASGAAGTYYVQVIYARASNDADGYASKVGSIRSAVQEANGILKAAATATGLGAILRVKCVSGVIEVKNAALPTSMSADSFSTIKRDLMAKGYNDPKVKYWVYYDDCVSDNCGGGQGNVNSDDRLTVSNLNNGNDDSPTYAISYSSLSPSIFLHELGHNLGAVQRSAPHSTDPSGTHPNGWHCWDGRDVMCYNDGAPRGSWYSTSYCSTEVFDCRKDDYFHRSPANTNYLATHWNIGNQLNRYLEFEYDPSAPDMTITTPTSGTVYNGCTATGTTIGYPTFVGSVCVQGSAYDSQSGVSTIKFYEDGALKATRYGTGSFSASWSVATNKVGAELTIVATSGDGGTNTYVFTINTAL